MWYGSGTLTVAADGTNATGLGTQFLGNVRVGDGIAIQGSASLHEVTGVTSNTQLTFAPPYAGPAGSGKAYRVAPVLGYDKDLSDAFNALRLQFGDQLSNLQPWATAATQDAAQTALGMSVSGKAVATGTPAQGRAGLGLGSGATADITETSIDTTPGRMMRVGFCGLGGSGQSALPAGVTGFGYALSAESVGYILNRAAPFIHVNAARSFVLSARGTLFSVKTLGESGDPVLDIYHNRNTTVDSNGFLKSASPIVNVRSRSIETNELAVGARFQRLGAGHYKISGTNGLRLDDGWYIETPHDKNGNKYFNVEWEQDHTPVTDAGVLDEPADVTLTIRCYERVWNPQTGQYDNGAPVDIPDGRWIDLRLNEVRQPEPEMPDEPGEPQQPTEPGAPAVPHMVTKAQGKAALIQAGLWQAVLDHVSGIEDETERMLAEIALHDAQDYHRNSPFLNATADALGLTEERKDELFILASNILL